MGSGDVISTSLGDHTLGKAFRLQRNLSFEANIDAKQTIRLLVKFFFMKT